MNSNFEKAIYAAIDGGKAILKVYDSRDFGTEIKEDNSPLTLADIASNKAIMSHLNVLDIPIISEENKEVDYGHRKQWTRCWLVDPLDGTKEFIKRNGEFTVNIALIEDGKPIFGVIYVPVTKELYIGQVSEKKAYKVVLDEKHHFDLAMIQKRHEIGFKNSTNGEITVVGSRSHMNEDTKAFIDQLKEQYKEIEIVSKGSSLKFCLVAEGSADLYPRFAPTMEWDTAAGHAICKAVGLQVISRQTDQELRYNKEDLLNSHFVVKK